MLQREKALALLSPTFGVLLLPMVALLKCGETEGVVFFRGKVSLR